jgi:hypothetical protein
MNSLEYFWNQKTPEYWDNNWEEWFNLEECYYKEQAKRIADYYNSKNCCDDLYTEDEVYKKIINFNNSLQDAFDFP